MEYIVVKRFKEKGICGDLNLRYGTVCHVHNDFIYCEQGIICAITSQNAYDYFARNDDGQGLRRGQLISSILHKLRKRDDDYQKRWDEIWEDESLLKFKRPELDDWIWNYEFYNAEIKNLEYILNKVS